MSVNWRTSLRWFSKLFIVCWWHRLYPCLSRPSTTYSTPRFVGSVCYLCHCPLELISACFHQLTGQFSSHWQMLTNSNGLYGWCVLLAQCLLQFSASSRLLRALSKTLHEGLCECTITSNTLNCATLSPDFLNKNVLNTLFCIATLIAGKSILCVLFKEFSEPDKFDTSIFNTAKYALSHSHCLCHPE